MRKTMIGVFAVLLVSAMGWAQEAGKAFVLLDEPDTVAKWKGVEAVTDNVKQGITAVKWVKANEGGTVTLPEVPRDWSAYGKLVFEMHSAKANGAKFIVQVTSMNENQKGDYYMATITADFEGWKTIELPLADFKPARNPKGWDSIDYFMMYSKGWNIEPMADTEIVLDNVRLEPAAK